MKVLLLVFGLILVAVVGVRYGRSGSDPKPVAPVDAPAPPASAKETAAPESEAGGRTAISGPAAKPAGGAGAAADPAAPQPIDPTTIAGGVDGAVPTDASSAGEASPYAAKYAGMTKEELRTAYDALLKLYEEQTGGSIDKDRQMPADALAQFANELSWLKEQAYGG